MTRYIKEGFSYKGERVVEDTKVKIIASLLDKKTASGIAVIVKGPYGTMKICASFLHYQKRAER